MVGQSMTRRLVKERVCEVFTSRLGSLSSNSKLLPPCLDATLDFLVVMGFPAQKPLKEKGATTVKSVSFTNPRYRLIDRRRTKPALVLFSDPPELLCRLCNRVGARALITNTVSKLSCVSHQCQYPFNTKH